MNDHESFAVDLARLRPREKDQSAGAIAQADEAGDRHGFHSREPHRRGGRAPSPRTGQIHAKVMPGIPEEIAHEAKRRGVQQGDKHKDRRLGCADGWRFLCDSDGR